MKGRLGGVKLWETSAGVRPVAAALNNYAANLSSGLIFGPGCRSGSAGTLESVTRETRNSFATFITVRPTG